MIHGRQFNFRFSELEAWVLERDLDLSVGAGEALLLLGPNGCGKSSLLKSIIKMIPALHPAMIKGQLDLDCNTKDVSYFSQNLASNFYFYQVLENWAERYSQVTEKCEQLHDSIFKSFSLGNFMRKGIEELSHGEKVRLGLALALLKDAEIYLFDEPLRALDAQNKALFLKFCKEYTLAGKTLIFTDTHMSADWQNNKDWISIHTIKRSSQISETQSESKSLEAVKVDIKMGQFFQMSSKQATKFELEKNLNVALFGANGVGKTQLLYSLYNDAEKKGLASCFLPVHLPLYFLHRSVEEDLRSIHSNQPGTSLAEFEQFISTVPLDLNKFGNDLSFGQKRVAAIAMLLCSSCNFYFLDEPFFGLDTHATAWASECLGIRMKQGKRIVYTAASLSELQLPVDEYIEIQPEEN